MTDSIEQYYDNFSTRFVEDIVQGNERIAHQLDFFHKAISESAKSVLVIGCGSGQGAHFIATSVAPNARLLAIDLSSENLRLAQSLFPDQRIEYRKVDVTRDAIEGEWDVIVLPDVYEHIPKDQRENVHTKLDRLLSQKGKILFTVPSPGKQLALQTSGEGLQIVDEVVTLEDLVKVASDTGGMLTYFNSISIWETNDYLHVMIERDAKVGPLTVEEMLPIKGWPHRGLFSRARASLGARTGLFRLLQSRQRKQILRRLAKATSDHANTE